jgi:hypothetical protein
VGFSPRGILFGPFASREAFFRSLFSLRGNAGAEKNTRSVPSQSRVSYRFATLQNGENLNVYNPLGLKQLAILNALQLLFQG